jgi:ABC-type taurine transport system substrate-binding protein
VQEVYEEWVWERFENWVSTAEALVFVGSSNAVSITSSALKMAATRNIPVFNFNLSTKCTNSTRADVYHVLGPAEQTLPSLDKLLV